MDQPLLEMEGYLVHPSKVDYAHLLYATCRRLHLEKEGRPHLRRLASYISLRGPNTLIANLRSPGRPKVETLRKLEESAGVSLSASLRALEGVGTPEQQPGTRPDDAAPADVHARLCGAIGRLSDRHASVVLGVVEALLEQQT